MNDLFGLVALFVLVLLNGFFVAAEFALVAVRRTRIDQLADEGNSAARAAQRALKNLDLYIAATQLGITMASLGIGFVAEPAIHHLIEGPLARAGVAEASVTTLSFVIAFSISTILHIVFGELAPKSIALQRAEQTTLAIVRPLLAFTAIFRYAIHALNWLGNRVVGLLGFAPVTGHHTAHSEEEIRMIVSASSQEGVLEDDEKELVYNVFDLSDTVVRSIMTPRVDMVVADASAPLRFMIELKEQHGYSRIPVYRGTPDNVVGIVHTGDVLRFINDLDHVTLGEIARPAYYVPESMRVSDLLKTIRKRKSLLAVVVDEFGGTAGVVTLEDVLEEIVGEIYDETDEEEEQGVVALEDGAYLLHGSLNIDDVEEVLATELDGLEEAGEFDTLAGFVTQHFGHIPEPGERFEFAGWEFTVEAADQRRVSRVRATRTGPVPPLEREGGAAYDG